MKLTWGYESLMLDRDNLMLVGIFKSDFVLGCFCLFWNHKCCNIRIVFDFLFS